MVIKLVNVAAVGFLSIAVSLGAGSMSWLPPETHLVMKLFKPAGDAPPDYPSFREMMAFLTDSEELLGAVPDRWKEGAEDLVVGQWIEDGQRRQVAVLSGEVGTFRGETGGHVAAAVAPGVAIFGMPQAVARCLQTQGRNALLSELQDSIEARFREPAAGWAWMGGDWPGFARDEESWPAWTLRGALTQLRSSALLTSVSGDRFRFLTTTDGGDSEVAAFLAAELKAHLATIGPGDNSPIQKSLDESTVRLEGRRVVLQLDLSGSVLRQLARSQNAQQVFRWRLGSAVREKRESILDLASMLELEKGSRVADVGAGRGFLAVRLARLVGEQGRVFAVDVSERALEAIRGRSDFEAYPQLETVLGAEDDPKLPNGSLDAAIIINAFHEMPKHEEMLRATRDSLRPGGRLLLLEPYSLDTRTKPRDQQVERHHLAPELVEAELTEMGFEILRRDDDFVKPDDPASPRRDGLVLGRKP